MIKKAKAQTEYQNTQFVPNNTQWYYNIIVLSTHKNENVDSWKQVPLELKSVFELPQQKVIK